MSTPLDAVVIGPLNVDIIAVGQAPLDFDELTRWMGLSKVSVNAAGSAGYVMMDLQRLGVRCGAISTLASDPMSTFLLRTLEDTGIDTSRIRIESGDPGIALYMLLFGSKKRPLTGQLATHAPWPATFSSEDLDYITRARLLHTGGYLHYPKQWNTNMAALYRHAKANGVITSLDPQFPLDPIDPPWMVGLEDLIEYVHVFLSDEDELRNITAIDDVDEAALRILEAGPQTVVIKRGALGSLVFTADGNRIEQRPYGVPEDEISDSIGAGDAYDAGFLLGILEGWPLEKTAQFACTVASFSLRGSGGTETVPDRVTAEQARTAYFDGGT